MLITTEEYSRVLRGYFFSDCVVRNRNMFTFVMDRWLSDEEAEQWEEEERDIDFREKRVVPFMRHKEPGKQWSWTDFKGWDRIVGGAARVPKDQFVGIQSFGELMVFVTGSGDVGEEPSIPNWRKGGPDRGCADKIKTIDGYAWYCGSGRSVGQRLGKGHWLAHTQALPSSEDPGDSGTGFRDIDGFGAEDVYAVGGKGDVWHFDGKGWQQIPFPSNTYLFSVCCGGDGQVYISGYEGLTFVGRGNRWRKIHDGGSIALPLHDMVWFEDRVWCTNENGVWTIRDGALGYVTDLPTEIAVCAGHLYVNDGVMLMAGTGGAAFRENGEWHSIVLRGRMERALREQASGG